MSVSFYLDGARDFDTEFNVANRNFVRLCELLGLDLHQQSQGYCGSLTGEALVVFREKVTFALDSVRAMPETDTGVPDVVHGRVLMLATAALDRRTTLRYS